MCAVVTAFLVLWLAGGIFERHCVEGQGGELCALRIEQRRLGGECRRVHRAGGDAVARTADVLQTTLGLAAVPH